MEINKAIATWLAKANYEDDVVLEQFKDMLEQHNLYKQFKKTDIMNLVEAQSYDELLELEDNLKGSRKPSRMLVRSLYRNHFIPWFEDSGYSMSNSIYKRLRLTETQFRIKINADKQIFLDDEYILNLKTQWRLCQFI